jgi:hypothetical protein
MGMRAMSLFSKMLAWMDGFCATEHGCRPSSRVVARMAWSPRISLYDPIQETAANPASRKIGHLHCRAASVR